jgi:hypothetical protein
VTSKLLKFHEEFLMIQFKRNPIVSLCAAFAVAFTLNACGNTQPVQTEEAFLAEIERENLIPTTSFVGEVSGTSAYIAIVERDGTVEVYVCDGTPTSVSIAQWFRGTLKGSALSAESDDGSKLTGTRNGSSLTGSVTLNGVQHTFTTSETNGTEAGLWLALADLLENGEVTRESLLGSTLNGWVVLSDGSQRGAAVFNKTGDVLITQPVPDFGEPIPNGVGPINSEIIPRTGSCHLYQLTFKNGRDVFTSEYFPEEFSQRMIDALRAAMARAVKSWSIHCEAKFGPIIGPNVPADS